MEEKGARAMLSFAANFWPLFWAIVGGGAAFTVLVTLAIAVSWPREERRADATLIQLAAAYKATNQAGQTGHEHATAA
jgi:hypothetical protein